MEQSKVQKYLLYALGEILLVVIGILIALQVNNWNEDRKENLQARAYHQRLMEDLQTEFDALDARIGYYEQVVQHARSAQRALQEPENRLGVSFLTDIYQATQNKEYRNSDDTWSELIAAGNIGLIPDPSLRSQLAQYYRETEAMLYYWELKTPYRTLVRTFMPVETQRKIQAVCEEWILGESIIPEPGLTQLNNKCEPDLTASEIKEAIQLLIHNDVQLLSRAKFESELNFHIADLLLKVDVYKRKQISTEKMLTVMQEYLIGDNL